MATYESLDAAEKEFYLREKRDWASACLDLLRQKNHDQSRIEENYAEGVERDQAQAVFDQTFGTTYDANLQTLVDNEPTVDSAMAKKAELAADDEGPTPNPEG